VGYLCANFSLPRPLCSRLRPELRDRQTYVRQHHRLIPPPRRRWHNIMAYQHRKRHIVTDGYAGWLQSLEIVIALSQYPAVWISAVANSLTYYAPAPIGRRHSAMLRD